MPQLTPTKAFVNAPVTKHVICLLAIGSIALSVLYLKQYGTLALNPHILQYRQVWRIVTVHMNVASESDLLLCTLLWFHFKTLERFFGSAKYAALLVTFLVYNAVLVFLTLCVGQAAVLGLYAVGSSLHVVYFDTIFNSVAPGPLAVLSSLYICHGAYVPVLYTFRVLLRKGGEPAAEPADPAAQNSDPTADPESPGPVLTMSNHVQVHALYALLLLNHGVRSIIPCLVGAVVGRLYTQNLLVGSGLCLRLFSRATSWHRQVLSHPLAAGYAPVSRSASPNPPPEDDEIAIDDLTSPNAARSASPPRPLRRQFLDTFLP